MALPLSCLEACHVVGGNARAEVLEKQQARSLTQSHRQGLVLCNTRVALFCGIRGCKPLSQPSKSGLQGSISVSGGAGCAEKLLPHHFPVTRWVPPGHHKLCNHLIHPIQRKVGLMCVTYPWCFRQCRASSFLFCTSHCWDTWDICLVSLPW